MQPTTSVVLLQTAAPAVSCPCPSVTCPTSCPPHVPGLQGKLPDWKSLAQGYFDRREEPLSDAIVIHVAKRLEGLYHVSSLASPLTWVAQQ